MGGQIENLTKIIRNKFVNEKVNIDNMLNQRFNTQNELMIDTLRTLVPVIASEM